MPQSLFSFPQVWKFTFLAIFLIFVRNLLLYPTKRYCSILLSIKHRLSVHLSYSWAFVDFTPTLNTDIGNTPDVMQWSITQCGWVVAIYQDIPDYGTYCGFNVKTTCSVTDYGRTVDICIRISISLSKCFNTTQLPQLNSLINIHGSYIGKM